MKIIYSIILVSACVLGFVSCSDDDGYIEHTTPSLWDHIYSGDKLNVYIEDETVKGVTADVKSEFKDAGDSGIRVDENGNQTYYIDNSYYMTIVLTDFPTAKVKTTLRTILPGGYPEFSGTVMSRDNMGREKLYTYTGEFTGGPLNHWDNQGLIIHFTFD